ncbi:MAG: hypothetical protein MUE40_08540 [Anaerolineae bacterium]|nr:hypothetical protein [Anaerolineae bacterium]
MKTGEDDAWAELEKQYGGQLHQMIRATLADQNIYDTDTVEDIAQKTWVVAFMKLYKYDHINSIRALMKWLNTTQKNFVRNLKRHSSSRPVNPLEDENDVIDDRQRSPEDIIIQREQTAMAVVQFFANIDLILQEERNPVHRLVIVLCIIYNALDTDVALETSLTRQEVLHITQQAALKMLNYLTVSHMFTGRLVLRSNGKSIHRGGEQDGDHAR